MMDEGSGAPRNDFEADKEGTPARTLAEGAIGRLRAEGGVFVEAVRATRMPMAVADPSLPGNPIVFANDAFLALSGYGMDEVLGQGPYFMNGPETDPADAARFREALVEDRDEVIETVQYRKDGSRFVASLFLSAFKDAKGRTLYHFLSYLDVTRRVAAEAEVVSRRGMEAALRASEARYRALFESMDEAYAVVEVIADEAGRARDFRFLEVNPAFMAHTTMPFPVGRTATELLGTPNPRWAEVYGRVAETGESIRLEEAEPTLGLTFDLNVFRLGGPGSRRIAVLFTDVTPRKRADAALRAAAARDAYRVALTDALRIAPGPVEAQGAAMRALGDHLGASRVMYGEADAGSAETFTNHREYRRDPAMPTSLGTHRWDDFGAYVVAEMRGGRTLVAADVHAHPGHSVEDLAAYEAVGIRAYLAVPLVREGRIVAYLAVNHTVPHAWTAEEVALVEETAERTWAAVERARAEAALRESEERLRRFGEASSDVLWIRDAETLRWEYLTPAFETIYGLSRERALTGDDLRNWAEFILPEDREAALNSLERVRGGEGVAFEYRIRRASDGEVRWVRDADFPMRDDAGRVRRIGGIGRDVTERKREADRMGVLVAELQHRTRNLLALVRNIARKSIERSPGLDEYDARLAALGRVQGLLSRSGAFAVALHDLVEAELQAAGDGVSDRVTVEGPPIELPGGGVQTVALALHELATNAVKYGAIGQAAGRLSITWRVEAREDGPSLLIAWRESGVVMEEGPPARRGYGSELITRALPYQLKARTRLEFGPDGVWCDILLPPEAFGALEVAS